MSTDQLVIYITGRGGACRPTVVLEFSELIKADQVQLIPDQGHQLAPTVVQSVVGLFLKHSG